MNHVQHFEIPYRVQPRAKKFYFEAFGWQLVDIPGTGYSFATTVPVEKNGMPKRPGAINGGLLPRSKDVQAPTILVKVGDINAHLARIEDAGGSIVVQPTAMGPVWYARIKDTEGNVIGVMQDRPEGQEKSAPAKRKAAKKGGKAAKKASKKKR